MKHKCKAKSKSTGEQCGNAPMLGGVVCRMHGGAAPQVKKASARRVLEEMVGPALTQLRNVLDDPDTPPNVRLAAAKDVLDRMGHRAPTQIEGKITLGALEAYASELEDDGWDY